MFQFSGKYIMKHLKLAHHHIILISLDSALSTLTLIILIALLKQLQSI